VLARILPIDEHDSRVLTSESESAFLASLVALVALTGFSSSSSSESESEPESESASESEESELSFAAAALSLVIGLASVISTSESESELASDSESDSDSDSLLSDSGSIFFLDFLISSLTGAAFLEGFSAAGLAATLVAFAALTSFDLPMMVRLF